MLIRVLMLLLLASSLFAGELNDKWPPGKTEKMTYEIKILKPNEVINYNYVEITRSNDGKNIFHVRQTLEMPIQSIKIISEEKYSAGDLNLISSSNKFFLPPGALASLGVDTLVIEAVRKGDSLYITSNSDKGPSETLALESGVMTSAGSHLAIRDMNLETGRVYKYSYINLLRFTGKSYQIQDVTDSVLNIEKITTPIGTFDCYKVRNRIPGAVGFSYYTADYKHIPLLIELLDPESNETIMTLTLQEYE